MFCVKKLHTKIYILLLPDSQTESHKKLASFPKKSEISVCDSRPVQAQNVHLSLQFM